MEKESCSQNNKMILLSELFSDLRDPNLAKSNELTVWYLNSRQPPTRLLTLNPVRIIFSRTSPAIKPNLPGSGCGIPIFSRHHIFLEFQDEIVVVGKNLQLFAKISSPSTLFSSCLFSECRLTAFEFHIHRAGSNCIFFEKVLLKGVKHLLRQSKASPPNSII